MKFDEEEEESAALYNFSSFTTLYTEKEEEDRQLFFPHYNTAITEITPKIPQRTTNLAHSYLKNTKYAQTTKSKQVIPPICDLFSNITHKTLFSQNPQFQNPKSCKIYLQME